MKRGKSRESSAAANKKPRRNPTEAPAAPAADNTGTSISPFYQNLFQQYQMIMKMNSLCNRFKK